ncbi:class I SAM-dependent methyltransferase [Methylobacterium durans]|uniref:class I SAM-dependent methyltransferase n=1 Tax=Methylobacterium durans TaxID=2202825 RepID=UPI003C6D1100
MSDSNAYHRPELEIALNPADQRQILLSVEPDQHRILDIGCGRGQSLMALEPDAAGVRWGIDVDFDAIVLGKTITTENIRLVVGVGEGLPFPSEYFDLLFSRVAMPYMLLPSAVPEADREPDTAIDGDGRTAKHSGRAIAVHGRQGDQDARTPGSAARSGFHRRRRPSRRPAQSGVAVQPSFEHQHVPEQVMPPSATLLVLVPQGTDGCRV